jgi:hypothetical protein
VGAEHDFHGLRLARLKAGTDDIHVIAAGIDPLGRLDAINANLPVVIAGCQQSQNEQGRHQPIDAFHVGSSSIRWPP